MKTDTTAKTAMARLRAVLQAEALEAGIVRVARRPDRPEGEHRPAPSLAAAADRDEPAHPMRAMPQHRPGD